MSVDFRSFEFRVLRNDDLRQWLQQRGDKGLAKLTAEQLHKRVAGHLQRDASLVSALRVLARQVAKRKWNDQAERPARQRQANAAKRAKLQQDLQGDERAIEQRLVRWHSEHIGVEPVSDAAAYLDKLIQTLDLACGRDDHDSTSTSAAPCRRSKRECRFEAFLGTLADKSEVPIYRALPQVFMELVSWPKFFVRGQFGSNRIRWYVTQMAQSTRQQCVLDELVALYRAGRKIKVERLLWDWGRLFEPLRKLILVYAKR